MRSSSLAIVTTVVMIARAVAAEPHGDLHLGFASRAGEWAVPHPQLGVRAGFLAPLLGGGLALDRTWFIATDGDATEPVRTRLLAVLLVPLTDSTTLRLAAGAARSTRDLVVRDEMSSRPVRMPQEHLGPSFELGCSRSLGPTPVQVVLEIAAAVGGYRWPGQPFQPSVELGVRLGLRIAP